MQFALEYKNKTKPTTLTKNNNNKNFPNPVESLKLWGNILTHCQEFKGKAQYKLRI